MSSADPLSIAVELLCGLEARGFPCALGGGLALGFWSIPRSTRGVDIDIFINEERISDLLTALQSMECQFSSEKATAQALAGDAVTIFKDSFPVDIFLPTIPFYEFARERIVRFTIAQRDIPVLSAESLCVFKMLFYRGKDIQDLERLAARRQERLDASWVRAQLIDMVGDDDERIASWDAIIALSKDL